MGSLKALHLLIGAVVITIIPILILYIKLSNDVDIYQSQRSNFPAYSENIFPHSSFENMHECASFGEDVNSTHPNCYTKFRWMLEHWRSHSCYEEYGVDGSACSVRSYLSTIEDHCPPLPGYKPRSSLYAESIEDLSFLFNNLTDNPLNYEFIKERVTRLWSLWHDGYQRSLKKHPKVYHNRKRKNIILHMGFLMTDKKLHFGEKSRKGGPLGELVQWSDLIASLFVLGHRLYVSTEKITLFKHLDAFLQQPPCPTSMGKVDLIITDIIGLRSFVSKHKQFIREHSCKIRLIDSFGTHVEFNTKSYFSQHRKELGGGMNPWGGHGFKLKQYWTFFPHTPDNSFLGFVVETRDVKPLFDRKSRNSVLIYGKEKYMWAGINTTLDVLKNLTEVHATVADLTNLQPNETSTFADVVNHGFLFTDELHSLLKSVKIFVGMGFPYEGPAPLEAIANGAVFINPSFDPPKSRHNTKFFADKPTSREWTSQCPYLETVGPPHAYTVDIRNPKELEKTIQQALRKEPKPFITEEFTTEGMLLRVTLLVDKEDLCTTQSHYPPKEALQIRVGKPGESCEKACSSHNLTCEPMFFHLVNKQEVLKAKNDCFEAEAVSSNVLAPFDCTLQNSSDMFSCASSSKNPVQRICPCRDYLPQQSSVCKLCV
ncbi:unnamed protein product [Auanema sp. JU1783]|nr:unnamed protein product [Auanema sp. JU1783]